MALLKNPEKLKNLPSCQDNLHTMCQGPEEAADKEGKPQQRRKMTGNERSQCIAAISVPQNEGQILTQERSRKIAQEREGYRARWKGGKAPMM